MTPIGAPGYKRSMGKVCALVCVVFFASCVDGESDPPDRVGMDDPTGETENPDPLADLAGKTWPELREDQRPDFMRFIVLPAMAETFEKFDPERFANFSCSTCHGSSAIDGVFEMPGNIPALDFANLPDGPIVGFMQKEVVPGVAELLGLTPFNPATGEGDIGCLTCHERAE